MFSSPKKQIFHSVNVYHSTRRNRITQIGFIDKQKQTALSQTSVPNDVYVNTRVKSGEWFQNFGMLF